MMFSVGLWLLRINDIHNRDIMIKAYGCVDCSISTPVMWCIGCSCPIPYKFRLPFPLGTGQNSGNWGCCLECLSASEGCWCDKCICKQCGFYQKCNCGQNRGYCGIKYDKCILCRNEEWNLNEHF